MNENKTFKIEDEALQNVAGGNSDSDTTYKVGSVVEFKVAYGMGWNDYEVMTGTITIARGQLYAIKSGIFTYTVKEENILTPPPQKPGVHATENGVHGSW